MFSMKISAGNLWVIGTCSLFAGTATYFVFHSHFIKVSIDYLSFIAGVFLFSDALYPACMTKKPFRRIGFTRAVRLIFGLFIIAIHLDQFLRYRVMSSEFPVIKIDWVDYVALSAGLFLIVEGTVKILRSKAFVFPGQISRLFRILIGVTVFMIHVIQFLLCRGNL
jgi:uncharacterized protein YjeT (DUF2065 family)